MYSWPAADLTASHGIDGSPVANWGRWAVLTGHQCGLDLTKTAIQRDRGAEGKPFFLGVVDSISTAKMLASQNKLLEFRCGKVPGLSVGFNLIT